MQTALLFLGLLILAVVVAIFFIVVALWDQGGRIAESLARLHKLRAGEDLKNWSFLYKHTQGIDRGDKGGYNRG
jgi:predicted PurR-regulated permease PerM